MARDGAIQERNAADARVLPLTPANYWEGGLTALASHSRAASCVSLITGAPALHLDKCGGHRRDPVTT
jgi:hypothetical protein